MFSAAATFPNIAMAYGKSRAVRLLEEAELFLDARYSKIGEPRAINRGVGGSVLDAKYGSILGTYVYDGAAVLPGLVNNYLSVPDEAALDITGDIEIVLLVSMSDWTPTVATTLVSKRASTGNLSFQLAVGTAGTLVFSLRVGGVDYFSNGTLTPPIPLVDETTYWLKFTRVASTGVIYAGHAEFSLQEPTSFTSWTPSGTRTAGNIEVNSAAVEIGSDRSGTNGNLPGNVYRAIIRNGIDGPAVLDVDLTNVANYATSFLATTGQTVTVNSTTVDTNDPKLLPHTGENYVFVVDGPAATSRLQYPSFTPSADSSVDMRIDFVRPVQTVACRLVDGFILWDLAVNGNLTIQYRDTVAFTSGGTVTAAALNAISPIGSRIQLRSVLDAAANTFTTYARAGSADLSDDTGWTQVAQTTPTNPMYSTSDAMTVGGAVSTYVNGLGAAIYAYRTTFNDVLTHAFDPTSIVDSGASSFIDLTGKTVSVNRATSGRKTALVTRPVWLFGTDDYLEVADNALLDFADADSFTLMTVKRQHHAHANPVYLVKDSDWDTSTLGPSYYMQTGRYITVQDGTNTTAAQYLEPTVGQLTTSIGMRDRATSKLKASANGVALADSTDTTVTGTLANTGTLRVGQIALNKAEFELVAVAVWRRVLTTDEIAAINDYYGTA